MEVDLSSIMVGVSKPTAPTDYLRLSAQDMAIPADIYSKNDAEESRVYDKEPENTSTDKNQHELATQICQCFEEFPEKLSTLKNTKLEGKSIEELQKIWSEIEYIMGAK
jgi:hypothetical protein